jgi:hypothetical protein
LVVAAVTYINNGKLFVGPHLLVGLSMVGFNDFGGGIGSLGCKRAMIWRVISISLGTSAVVGLFGWQAVTGMDIVQRIISKL